MLSNKKINKDKKLQVRRKGEGTPLKKLIRFKA